MDPEFFDSQIDAAWQLEEDWPYYPPRGWNAYDPEIYPCCEHCREGCTRRHHIRCMVCVNSMIRAFMSDYQTRAAFHYPAVRDAMYAFLAKHGPV